MSFIVNSYWSSDEVVDNLLTLESSGKVVDNLF